RARVQPRGGSRARGGAQQRAATHCRADGKNGGAGGMIYSRIVGTGSYLPPRVMTNHDFAARLETSDAWIRSRTGIVQRHIADESQTSSDLALEAARQALKAADVKVESIDLILVATST